MATAATLMGETLLGMATVRILMGEFSIQVRKAPTQMGTVAIPGATLSFKSAALRSRVVTRACGLERLPPGS